MARQHRFHSVKPLADSGHEVDQLAYYAWVKPTVAMRHLGLRSLSALYRLIREHRLPYGRIGRHYRFRRDHLDQWAVRRGVDALAVVSKGA